MRAKPPSPTIVSEVNQVLATVWNPIGVLNPHLNDEYLSYAPKIAGWLDAGVEERRLSDHLQELERTSMGLMPNPENAERTAKALLALKE